MVTILTMMLDNSQNVWRNVLLGLNLDLDFVSFVFMLKQPRRNLKRQRRKRKRKVRKEKKPKNQKRRRRKMKVLRRKKQLRRKIESPLSLIVPEIILPKSGQLHHQPTSSVPDPL
jgi:Holliday junction resolvase RusA-like endonuclease